MEVLLEWEGRQVLVIPFLGPGISFEPVRGPLTLEHPRKGVVRLRFDQMGIALPKATFIEADWVAGHEDTGCRSSRAAPGSTCSSTESSVRRR